MIITSQQSIPENKSKVLVVEDDRAYSKVFQRKLTMQNFDVSVSNGLEDIVEIVGSIEPDVLILDLVLPGKSGFEIIEDLRASAHGGLIILVASNLSQSSDKEKALSAGANDYFIKSNISVNEMVERVKNAINEKHKINGS
jgi:DNA-binding response OmpR family regulator